MKKTFKAIMCIALVAALIASFAGCAKINYVTNGTIKAINEVKSGEWQNAGEEDAEGEGADANADPVVLEKTFEAGTYGGVKFDSVKDVVDYYVEAYNYTKTLKAPYTENGNKIEGYKLMGDEKLEVYNLKIEGKENDMINKMVPGILKNIFKGYPKGLVPSLKYTVEQDADTSADDIEFDMSKSALTEDDVLACNVVDNGDGTINITIQPKAAILSMKGKDSQGHFFNVLGDISSTVETITVLSFSEGTIQENFVVDYKGGTGTVTIDTKTKEITAADFEMKVHIDVKHANITVIKNKSASLDVRYTNHYPCSDEFMNNVGLYRN